MANRPYDPVSAMKAAIQTVFGWAAAVFALTFLGLWLGLSIGSREIVGPVTVWWALVLAPLAWLVMPPVMIPLIVTAITWYLPLKLNSSRAMIVMGIVNFAVWLGFAIWLFHDW